MEAYKRHVGIHEAVKVTIAMVYPIALAFGSRPGVFYLTIAT